MTTKEQERKALEQIKKILASLGDVSYVGTAIDGMIEDAEQNIELDAAFSWKERSENNIKLAEEYKEKLKMQESETQHFKDLYENEEKNYNECHRKLLDMTDKCADYINNGDSQRQKIEELEIEVIRLKAKLYDLMTK